MVSRVNIVWFKRDLRLADHAPLWEAAKRGPVLPLYIVEPELWKCADSSRRHWCFIRDGLVELQKDLRALGLDLVIRIGAAETVFANLLVETGGFSLWSHQETGNGWTFRRDLGVKALSRAHGIAWQEFPSNGVVRGLPRRDGWAKARDAAIGQPLCPELTSHQATPCIGIRTDPLPQKNDALFGSFDIGNVQAGGRQEGLLVLSSFLTDRSRNYLQTISKPGISARHCSRLSAHLTFGTLSVREVEQATRREIDCLLAFTDKDSIAKRRNLAAFLSRLAWHCHFVQKLEQQPHIEYQCMHAAFEGMREPHFRDDFFEAWKAGQTGYPLVDACMRSLKDNGWITFRMRAMLVSFASYHLWLDWRKTAPFMAGLFTDYEPAIHYSQFQMQSGVTGINAIRMYNPIKQSIDQDPEARFIRRYVPELRDVPAMFAHEPWRMDRPLGSYPPPIVHHQAAVRFARAEIAKRWSSPGFRDEARQVHEKLGSRKKQPNRHQKTKPVDKKQMQFDF
jgi:deoxyribodipyrimidine photo-lyase